MTPRSSWILLENEALGVIKHLPWALRKEISLLKNQLWFPSKKTLKIYFKGNEYEILVSKILSVQLKLH